MLKYLLSAVDSRFRVSCLGVSQAKLQIVGETKINRLVDEIDDHLLLKEAHNDGLPIGSNLFLHFGYGWLILSALRSFFVGSIFFGLQELAYLCVKIQAWARILYCSSLSTLDLLAINLNHDDF